MLLHYTGFIPLLECHTKRSHDNRHRKSEPCYTCITPNEPRWPPAYLRLQVDDEGRPVRVVVVAEVLVEQLVDVGGGLEGDETRVEVGARPAARRVRQARDGHLHIDG